MAGQIELILTEEFKKSYKKLPEDIKRKVKKQLNFLSSNPAHPSLRIHKLNGEWEFYVDIHYRCFFLREGNMFKLLTVGIHKIVDRY
ncbi:MAG: cytotoxin [Nitrospirae bacterium]|nr:MAG: cytotoxin [Nitrospirota bacterium]